MTPTMLEKWPKENIEAQAKGRGALGSEFLADIGVLASRCGKIDDNGDVWIDRSAEEYKAFVARWKQKHDPTKLAKFAAGVEGLAKWATGVKLVSLPVRQARAAVCDGCDRQYVQQLVGLSAKRCAECGCYLVPKQALADPKFTCPLRLWDNIPVET